MVISTFTVRILAIWLNDTAPIYTVCMNVLVQNIQMIAVFKSWEAQPVVFLINLFDSSFLINKLECFVTECSFSNVQYLQFRQKPTWVDHFTAVHFMCILPGEY